MKKGLFSGVVATLSLLVAAASSPPVSARGQDIPTAMQQMADAERAFARRAGEVGAKQAFLEWFSDEAVGFESGRPAPAKDGIRKQPDVPADSRGLFWWEPRFGDISSSGDLGWLTGPVKTSRADRDGGAVRHGNYTSIWKRQRDGAWKVVIDIGSPPPAELHFPPGLTRAAVPSRFARSEIPPLATASLLDADRALMTRARASLAEAYGPVLSPVIRMHRAGRMPLENDRAALAWLREQPVLTGGESLYAEVSLSGDFGYTWGSYAHAQPEERGHYVRVWVRDADGAWKVVLDVTQHAAR